MRVKVIPRRHQTNIHQLLHATSSLRHILCLIAYMSRSHDSNSNSNSLRWRQYPRWCATQPSSTTSANLVLALRVPEKYSHDKQLSLHMPSSRQPIAAADGHRARLVDPEVHTTSNKYLKLPFMCGECADTPFCVFVCAKTKVRWTVNYLHSRETRLALLEKDKQCMSLDAYYLYYDYYNIIQLSGNCQAIRQSLFMLWWVENMMMTDNPIAIGRREVRSCASYYIYES